MKTLLASGTLQQRTITRSCAKVLSLTFGALFCSQATAQEAVFSVGWQGQTTGQQDNTSGRQITDGDLLVQQLGILPGTTVPLPVPQVRVPATFLQAYNLCAGHAPGTDCGLELDAVSYGQDALLLNLPAYQFGLYFSVDEWAQGISTSSTSPDMFSEAAAFEASADIFRTRYQGVGPFGPGSVTPNNLLIADGDGRNPNGLGVRPGLGLIEPNLPSIGVPDSGTNLDALEKGAPFSPTSTKVFFSLQGGLLDPFELTTPSTNSAQLQGFQGGDILQWDPVTNLISLYVSGDELGLDNLGIGTDDLDALVVVENGIPGYQAPAAMYDWTTGASDLILFSVRRGSAVTGQLDNQFSIPITPGDVLMPPIGGPLLGSANPAIFAAAETLGLSTSRLTGSSDELNALDAGDTGEGPINDCNHNGIEDAEDIADGTSPDVDGNGRPDECEDPGGATCECTSLVGSPCSNPGATDAGCSNSTGVGGTLVGTGTSSLATDSLVLTSSQLPLHNFGLTFTGNGLVSPAITGAGLRCVGGTALYRLHIGMTGAGGTFSYGPGIIADANTFPNFLTILSGETWHFQTWYRDPVGGPCLTSNMTNAWSVTFTP